MPSPTPTPQPQQDQNDAAASEEVKTFDPMRFPSGLVAAAREAAEAREELRRHAAALPWSREPHPGWEAPEQTGGMHGYRRSRPATEGWTVEQKAKCDSLWERCRKTS